MGFSVIKDSWSSQDVDIITIFVFGYLLRSGPLPPSLKNFNVVETHWTDIYTVQKAKFTVLVVFVGFQKDTGSSSVNKDITSSVTSKIGQSKRLTQISTKICKDKQVAAELEKL